MPPASCREMTEALDGACDLCGEEHPAGSCIQASERRFLVGNFCALFLQSQCVKQHESQLAYQSLPGWVAVQEGGAGRQVVARERLPHLTQLGPLVAPHTPHLPPCTSFPLKICHKGGGHTFLDLSRKWLCNWLSLIPVGSPSSHNLLACQIDDLIYYVSTEDIPAGSELVVWYAPFYQPKVQKELEEVGSPHSLVGASVVIRRLSHRGQPSARKPEVAAPSLARIVVGQGKVTFTHHSVHPSDGDDQAYCEVTDIEDKCAANTVALRHSALPEPSSSVMLQGFVPSKKYSHGKKIIRLYVGQPPPVSSGPSIQLAPVREDFLGPECVVRLTITAASEAGEEQDLTGEDAADDMPLPLPSEEEEEGTKNMPATTASRQRRKYKQLNGQRAGMCVAGSDTVKQLPPRALGARDPRPWTCAYCCQPYTCLHTFTTHLKAHLLWLVGRRHVCGVCGTSLSSADLLQRHRQAAHPGSDLAQPHRDTDESKGASKTVTRRKSVKRKGVCEEEKDEDEAVDDPDGPGALHRSLKNISALPTKPIEGPHSCQICPKSFHKPEYLLRHLRKHSGDFTCQSCLKVFARKESLLKHLCPGGGQETSLSCPVCDRSFMNPRLLHQHHLKHQGAKKCEVCGRVVSSLDALHRHRASCPSVQVTKCYQCEVCGKQLGTPKQLETHRAHHRQQRHCHLCNKPYNNPSYLARHLPLCRQSHQLSSLGRVACEDCGKEFTDATAFRAHYHTHTHPFKCLGCNTRFQTRVGFEVHVCGVEQRCDQCGATFRSLQALNRHAAVHGPPHTAARPATAASTGRPTVSQCLHMDVHVLESLGRHRCSVEAEVRAASQAREDAAHPCSVCGAHLANRRTLTAHLRSAHGQSSGKVLSCETCGKGFYRRDLLRQHQAVHGPPSLPCPTCHKLFKTHKSLEVHTLIHLNIKRFTCKYCNKKFHQKVNLIRHERSHLPRGTVKCQYCATHCSSTEELKAHLLSHTLSQDDQEDPPQDGSALTLSKKEAHHAHMEGARQVLLPHFTSHTVVEPQLKFVSGSKGELGAGQPLCGSGHVLAASSGLHGNSEGLKIIVKETTASSLKPEMSAGCGSLVPGFRSKVVHGVVPVMASQLTLQAAAVPHAEAASQATVFLPQRISNFSLTAAEAPLATEYMVPTSPPMATASPHHTGNSSVFKVTNDSLNPDECRLPSNVLITSAAVSALDGTEDCHLGASEECHETMETDQAVSLPSSSQASKVGHLTLSPASACLYQPASMSAAPGAGSPQVHDCHVLSGEQIVQSVVLVAEPTVPGC
ncbi:Zinc finger protein 26 [Chionoecetes opilio]|uniref:Zinc finger protein 26 n=1 Tax=Chionoecetes opilio TaxID=41210 RepID=A0A8J5CYQ9_CHIOP|nr:Zinc finger protein 26 [Chionoecetes opilio]